LVGLGGKVVLESDEFDGELVTPQETIEKVEIDSYFLEVSDYRRVGDVLKSKFMRLNTEDMRFRLLE